MKSVSSGIQQIRDHARAEFGKEGSLDKGFQNIRAQMAQSFDRAISRSAYELKQAKAELMSEPPKRAGFGIDIRTGWVTAMKSDLTVVSGGFAKGQMRGAAKFYGGTEEKTYTELSDYLANPINLSHRFSTKTTAAKEMVCFPQTRTSITPKEIEDPPIRVRGSSPIKGEERGS